MQKYAKGIPLGKKKGLNEAGKSPTHLFLMRKLSWQ